MLKIYIQRIVKNKTSEEWKDNTTRYFWWIEVGLGQTLVHQGCLEEWKVTASNCPDFIALVFGFWVKEVIRIARVVRKVWFVRQWKLKMIESEVQNCQFFNEGQSGLYDPHFCHCLPLLPHASEKLITVLFYKSE